MDFIKKMDSLIVKATSESLQSIPIQLLRQILSLINQRADMPKYAILSISKRLVSKNKRVLLNIFVTLEYLIYECQLALYSQISAKQLLFKISGLLMNKDIDPDVKKKILQTIYCCQQLFRPHEDLLPLFFQFYAGVLRNGFDIPHGYRSPFRPQKLKQYKKSDLKAFKPASQKPVLAPTVTQHRIFEQIRQKLILTNQIIDNANPGQNVKQNGLLLEMIQEIKQSQKTVNKTINENPTEAIMELALATNDDIFITYRRFKDLQKNKKPEPFILTQLASDIIKQHQLKKTQNQILKSIPKSKVEQKPSFKQISTSSRIQPPKKIQSKKQEDIFDKFQIKEQVKKQPKKMSSQNIMDLLDDVTQKQPVKAHSSPNIDLLDIQTTQQSSKPTQINNIFDLLDQPSSTNKKDQNYMGNFEDLMGTAQYNLPPIPGPSGNGITLNLANPSNFQTQVDIKQYSDSNPVMDKFDELTSKFLNK